VPFYTYSPNKMILNKDRIDWWKNTSLYFFYVYFLIMFNQ
jgi:hypothetical protein